MSNQKAVNKKSVNGSAGHKGLRRINVNVIADYTTKSEDWAKFGYTEVDVMQTKNDNEIVGKSGMKIIVQNNNLRVAMPENMTFIPHEAIDELNENLEQKLIEFNPKLKKDGFKIDKIIKKESRNGNTCHWIVRTNVTEEVKGSHIKNDKVNLGFTIRNGYNTSTSLGIDIFTFRLVCENGAFVRSKSLQKMSFKHVGKDPKKLFAEFATALMQATQDWIDVMKDYERMAATKLNQKMIQYIYEKNSIIPDRFYPKYYNIADATKLKKDQPLVTLTNEGKSMTLWQNLNDLTKDVWRSTEDQKYRKKNDKEGKETGVHKGIAFSEMSWREKQLHQSIVHILDNPEEFK